jgi:hypothetical protein
MEMDKEKIIQQYKDIANTFQSFDILYDDILKNGINSENVSFCLDTDYVWKRLSLKWLYDYFLENEEYEKVSNIKKWMDDFFIGDDKKQKELNLKMDSYIINMFYIR